MILNANVELVTMQCKSVAVIYLKYENKITKIEKWKWRKVDFACRCE